jgi:hypothetical protein
LERRLLNTGSPVFLLIPSPAQKRILHRGEVIESDGISFVARFDNPIAAAVGSDVNALSEINGKFFQQGAVVTALRPDSGNVIVFRRNGEAISAETRQTYRVSVVTAGFNAKVGKVDSCPLIDISAEGFAVIVPDRLDLGSVVSIKLMCDGRCVETPARVQTVKELDGGKFRYGFLVPRDNVSARTAIQKISAEMQRLQLKRLRGAA